MLRKALVLGAVTSALGCSTDADCGKGATCFIPTPAAACAATIAEGEACHPAGTNGENVGRQLCCEAGTSCSGGSVWWRTCGKVAGECKRKTIKKRYECKDKRLSDGRPWHDSRTWRGGGFTCQDYKDWDICESKGHKYGFDGKTANDACCACGGGKQGKRICPPRVRQAWSSLDCHERKHYMDAVQAFRTNDPDQYAMLVTAHVNQFGHAHGTSAFLHWHRWYLLGYENALRAQPGFECITVPYWDWEMDSGNEFHSYVLREDTFGSWDGADPVTGCVTNGVAKGWTAAPMPFDEATGTRCIRRHFQDPPPPAGFGPKIPFSGPAMLAGMVIGNPNETNPLFESFRGPLEGNTHGWPHIVVGGWGADWMGAPPFRGHMSSAWSPDDPLFFVHHCNVDRIFAIFQDYHAHDFVDGADIDDEHHYAAVSDHPLCPPGCVSGASSVARGVPGAHADCPRECNNVKPEDLALDAAMPFSDADGATPEVLKGRVTPRMVHNPTKLGGGFEKYSYSYGTDSLAAALDANPAWAHRNAWTIVEPRDEASDPYVPVDECGAMPPARPAGCEPQRGQVTFDTCGDVFAKPAGWVDPTAAPEVAEAEAAAAGAKRRASAQSLPAPTQPKRSYRDALCQAAAAQCGMGSGDTCPEADASAEAEQVYVDLARHFGQTAKQAHFYHACEAFKAYGCGGCWI